MCGHEESLHEERGEEMVDERRGSTAHGMKTLESLGAALVMIVRDDCSYGARGASGARVN